MMGTIQIQLTDLPEIKGYIETVGVLASAVATTAEKLADHPDQDVRDCADTLRLALGIVAKATNDLASA